MGGLRWPGTMPELEPEPSLGLRCGNVDDEPGTSKVVVEGMICIVVVVVEGELRVVEGELRVVEGGL